MAPSKFIFNLFLQVSNHNHKVNSHLHKGYSKTPQSADLKNAAFKAPELQHFTALVQPQPTVPFHDEQAPQQLEQHQQEDAEKDVSERGDDEEEDMQEEEEEMDAEGTNDAVASVYKQFRQVIERTQQGEPMGKRQRRKSNFYDYDGLDY